MAVGFAATLAAAAFSINFSSASPQHKLLMAEQAVAQLYVDSVDESKLVEDAIRGMLEKLDPHSSYTSAEETKEVNEPLQGNFSGIGITFNMNRDTLYVIQTVSGGPSERVGVLAGDRIIAVNDTAIAGVKMKNNDIMKRLRGPKGTDVDITVLRMQRGVAPDTIPFTITRAGIPINSDTTAYLRLNKFAADTHREVAEAVKRLKKEGMTQLILDLTDNGGGYLQAATDLVSELLEPGRLSVYTEGLRSPRYDFHTSPANVRGPMLKDGRLVVMVNQYTASAAEITSGAVQDWDRGVIVGRRTFGKGLVQRPIPLPDGSMIRLTVAHYYTPTGRDIQKPYTKGDEDAYRRDIEDRFNHGELMHRDSIKYIDSLRRETLVNKRAVYGGGGITPDVFVPLDTTEYTKYYRNVMAKGLINRFAIAYVDEHRKEIRKQYRDDDAYVKGFEVTDQMLAELRKMADEEGVEFNIYSTLYNRHDPIFREALKTINSQDYTTILQP